MAEVIVKMTGGVIRQQKNTILKNVDIEIQNGEFVYLIGKVGSGKSSFLKTLYAELPLEYGTAEVAGFQLKKIKKSQIPLLRRKCGIVFQDFKLLTDRNVYDNLEFVLRATGWKNKKAIKERIDTVLDKVGMTDKQHQMPHQLSGGEQQRIVLARALLNAPPLILADEPTGNIDPETSYKLIELLREICDTGKTIIIATHQYDLIEKYPGRVICCENGELHEKVNPSAGEVPEELPSLPGIEEIIPGEMAGNMPEEAGTITSPTVSAEAAPTESPEENVTGKEEVRMESETEILREELSGQGQEQSEEDIMAMIGKLDYPEITAFDYELEEHIPVVAPYILKEEEEDIPEPSSQGVEDSVPDSAIRPEPTGDTTPNTANKKENPPVMDLELIE